MSTRSEAEKHMWKINARNAVISFERSKDKSLTADERYDAQETSNGSFAKLRELRGLPPFGTKMNEIMMKRIKDSNRRYAIAIYAGIFLCVAGTGLLAYLAE